jgi:hypothetical protein
MKTSPTSLESILCEALCFEAEAFDRDQAVPGAELVRWFADWRRRARAMMRSNLPTSSVLASGQEFRRQLVGALHALQTMQDRAGVGGFSPPTDAEMEELFHALDHGGIQVTAGQFKATVFKHPAKWSHKRR